MELDEIINKSESKCLGAVEHVGSANYADREREARQWVREAFNSIRKSAEETTIISIKCSSCGQDLKNGDIESSYIECAWCLKKGRHID